LQENNSGFVHKLFEPRKLKRINEEGQRLYVTDSGDKYPSVTTVLGKLGQRKLHEWRKRVGEAEANKIARQASSAGTAVHNVAEKYMLNDPTWREDMPIPVSRFLKIKPYLDDNVDEVYGIELQMYSNELRTAGTADLLCKYNGKNTLLDFKTSKRRKHKKDITSYFMQCAAYSEMAKEHYGFEVEQIVILMAVHEDDPIVFIEDCQNYVPMTKKFFELYHRGLL